MALEGRNSNSPLNDFCIGGITFNFRSHTQQIRIQVKVIIKHLNPKLKLGKSRRSMIEKIIFLMTRYLVVNLTLFLLCK